MITKILRLPFLNISNLIFTILLISIVWIQGPVFINNMNSYGTVISEKDYLPIFPIGYSSIKFPTKNHKNLVLFWATWCGPCKIEMNRLKTSVENKKISPGKIFAINPFEDSEIVKQYLLKNNFPFIFIDAPEITSLLNIRSTPTTLFIENGKITSASSGLSLIGIWRAEWYL